MTFDEYWEKLTQLDRQNSCRYMAYKAWDAATVAERQRCREIAQVYRQHYNAFGRNVALAIEGEIGE